MAVKEVCVCVGGGGGGGVEADEDPPKHLSKKGEMLHLSTKIHGVLFNNVYEPHSAILDTYPFTY